MLRQITVDIDVFARIWAERKPQETNENQVLRRILLREKSEKSGSIAENLIPLESTSLQECKEDKPSALFEDMHSELRRVGMGKIRWVDDIAAVLRDLGGKAALHTIYREVEKKRLQTGRSTPPTLEAVIRRTLEDHSSDSANFKSDDLFRLVGRGEWALR